MFSSVCHYHGPGHDQSAAIFSPPETRGPGGKKEKKWREAAFLSLVFFAPAHSSRYDAGMIGRGLDVPSAKGRSQSLFFALTLAAWSLICNALKSVQNALACFAVLASRALEQRCS